jgi:hypothetical protein
MFNIGVMHAQIAAMEPRIELDAWLLNANVFRIFIFRVLKTHL